MAYSLSWGRLGLTAIQGEQAGTNIGVVSCDHQMSARSYSSLQRCKEGRFKAVLEVGSHQPHLTKESLTELIVELLAVGNTRN